MVTRQNIGNVHVSFLEEIMIVSVMYRYVYILDKLTGFDLYC
jgi:hypothetical protein